MRKWRVGTFSMGLSLIFLGVFLFLSQVDGTQMWEPFIIWWPFILIVLGIEIVVYLFLSKQENPVLKYDFLSIFFIAIFGTIAIGFTVLTSTGIMEELQSIIRSEKKTFDLPIVEQTISNDIKRVVIEAGNQPLTIEASSSEALHIMGTYRAVVDKLGKPPIEDTVDYMKTSTVGNTLYVYFKEPSFEVGPLTSTTRIEATVIIPDRMLLEVRGESHQKLDLYPGEMAEQWIIDHKGDVRMH